MSDPEGVSESRSSALTVDYQSGRGELHETPTHAVHTEDPKAKVSLSRDSSTLTLEAQSGISTITARDSQACATAQGNLCQTIINQRASIAVAAGKESVGAFATAAPGRCAIASAVCDDDDSTWRNRFKKFFSRSSKCTQTDN